MGILDSVLGMVGIGQPKVTLELDRSSCGPGGLITCTASAEGGSRPLPIAAFTAQIIQNKVVKAGKAPSTDREALVEESAPAGGAMLRPGKRMQWTFALQVPADAPPTGAGVEYQVGVWLECQGWHPSAERALEVSSAPEPTAGEDAEKYLVLPEPRRFRHSSVHGDYRVLLCDGGFVTTWKTELSVRDSDGSQRCRIPGWGKSMAVSPDGRRLVASNDRKQLALFDLATGDRIGEVIEPGDYVGDVLWLADDAILAASSRQIRVYDAGGQLRNTIDDLAGSFYVGGLAPAKAGFYVTDANGSRVLHADASGAVLASVELRYPRAVSASRDGSRLAIECHSDRVAILDAALRTVATWKLPGKRGVRWVGQEDGSHTHFKHMPHLAPDNRSVLVQDGSGQLWRVAADGKPSKVWARDVLDHVEDAAWVDGRHLLAVLNSGRVRKLSVDGAILFDHADAEPV